MIQSLNREAARTLARAARAACAAGTARAARAARAAADATTAASEPQPGEDLEVAQSTMLK